MAREAENTANITAHSTALIALDSDIRGNVSFGPGCIVHPKAIIHAMEGDIIFGKDCVVEEGARIIHSGCGTMTVGQGNMFMVGSKIESSLIGEFNTFQTRSCAPSSVQIGSYCTLSPGTTLEPPLDLSVTLSLYGYEDIRPPAETSGLDSDQRKQKARLEDYTVVYGADSARRKWHGKSREAEQNLRTKHLEYLREILPKYNRMRPV